MALLKLKEYFFVKRFEKSRMKPKFNIEILLYKKTSLFTKFTLNIYIIKKEVRIFGIKQITIAMTITSI